MTTAQAIETVGASRGAYPQPLNAKDATLDNCPLDYYSTSRSCCPSAYTPWTDLLGGRRLCIGTITVRTTPPPIVGNTSTAGIVKPTQVVTGVVFAMQYAVQEPQGILTPEQSLASLSEDARKTLVSKDELYVDFYKADAKGTRLDSGTPPPLYREQNSEFDQAELYSLKPSKEAPLEAPVDLRISDSPTWLLTVTRLFV
ncbi:hypothetical protein MMYC01_205246 [Madurella mycetomatis]|uniref:Uncharacterized protein n=1 Tax=Madurella mycetomatis TaxID=100816 RepID=A0A175W2C7_9PEZI|nr:hypothetical protein MMYC01_205246 [Madurella mycetomatis]